MIVALSMPLALGAGCSSSGECELAPFEDPAPHRSGVATVSGGVELGYLDFGGSGDVLLFLAGAGNSAHVFDEFATRFVDSFHVLALTRRGFGESSQPSTGYDTTTLAEDVAAFLAERGIERAYIAGHSLAGAEMTRLAVLHPGLVIKLVYLDAAYDWASSAQSVNPAPPPTQPAPTAAQVASPDAFAAFVGWVSGVESMPVADIRATNRFDCSGRLLRSRTPAAIAGEVGMQAAAHHPDYAHLPVPALSIYTAPETPADMFPWLTGDSPQFPAAAAYFPAAQASLASQRAAFAAAAPDALVVEMRRVPHFLFLAEPDAVAAHVRAFLATP